MLTWGHTGPLLQVLGEDGATVERTLLLPEPSKGGLQLTWENLGIEKTKFDRTTVIVYPDPTKRYRPKISLKYGVYDDLVDSGASIGTADGQTPALEDLLALIATYQGGRLALLRGEGEPAVRVYMKEKVTLSPAAGMVYQDITLEFTGWDAYPSQDLGSAAVPSDLVLLPVTSPVQQVEVTAPLTLSGTTQRPVIGLDESAVRGGLERKTVVLTLIRSTGTVDLGASFEILGEVSTAPGRFRLYRDAKGRDADLARTVILAEPNNVGLLLEDVFTDAALEIAEAPAPCVAGPDGLCAYAWSGILGATITLDLLVKEA